MLASYRRWIFENNHLESVEALRDWIVQVSEFETIATETIKSITNKKKKHSDGSFFSDQKISSFRQCKGYRKHGVGSCEVFQIMNINNEWMYC